MRTASTFHRVQALMNIFSEQNSTPFPPDTPWGTSLRHGTQSIKDAPSIHGQSSRLRALRKIRDQLNNAYRLMTQQAYTALPVYINREILELIRMVDYELPSLEVLATAVPSSSERHSLTVLYRIFGQLTELLQQLLQYSLKDVRHHACLLCRCRELMRSVDTAIEAKAEMALVRHLSDLLCPAFSPTDQSDNRFKDNIIEQITQLCLEGLSQQTIPEDDII